MTLPMPCTIVASVYTSLVSSPEGIASVQAMIANAINGYLDHGGSSSNLQQLLTVPTTNLENLFGRLSSSSGAASRLKGNTGRYQMELAMGEASVFYWRNQIDTTGSWAAYMSGNVAIDYASMPYWADAAMFGAQFTYNQVNGTDAAATSMVFSSTLIGSLAVGAGKVVFGWVPKVSVRPRIPHGSPSGNPSFKETFGFKCFDNSGDTVAEGTVSADSLGEAEGLVAQGAAQASNIAYCKVNALA